MPELPVDDSSYEFTRVAQSIWVGTAAANSYLDILQNVAADNALTGAFQTVGWHVFSAKSMKAPAAPALIAVHAPNPTMRRLAAGIDRLPLDRPRR
jgi:hypothetical protein